jgi:hypothetical protein
VLLVWIEAAVSVIAAIGGLLLTIEPGGSLLGTDVAALGGSPFHTWRVPGVLLFVLVGGGFAHAAACLARRAPFARVLRAVIVVLAAVAL